MSQYLNGRSGNRGCCSQPCRSSYDLCASDGRTLIRDRHLLSLRDFNASQQLGNMIAAGITSFKIEGRLKDLAYVKNITAYYRQMLDTMMDGHSRASSGRSVFYFTPDPDRTFNRGYTDYFLRGRQPMASFATQKSLGKRVGEVVSLGSNNLVISGKEQFSNGDGLCFFDSDGRLQGFMVNGVQGRAVVPNVMPDIEAGTTIWRNNDQQFEKQLAGRSAERRIAVRMLVSVVDKGFMLELEDEDGVKTASVTAVEHQLVTGSVEKASALIVKQLSKLGDTPFAASEVEDTTKGRYFLPVSVLNELRRKVVEEHIEHRISYFRPADCCRADRCETSPVREADYRANVVNSKAEAFYKRHGVKVLERGLEQTADYEGKALMTTKYCLRYELGCCLQGKNKGRPQVSLQPADNLVLVNNTRRFRLEFDCRECLMRIYPMR